ncbi:MAG: hypothetical protein ACJ74W_05045 [Pyrinomonadaceae bacterium]
MRINRSITALLFALIAVSSAVGQPPRAAAPVPKSQERRKLPVEVETFLLGAQLARPEIAADLLLRVVEAGLVPEQTRKIELLEEAYRRAADAQQPLKRRAWGGMVDTRTGYLSFAYDLKLDALSLQCRALRLLLPIDGARARKLFADIAPPKLEPLTCADALYYDLDDYYDTLREIVKTTFSAKERQQGKHVEFMLPYLDNMVSPLQVAQSVRTILALDTTPAQLADLVLAFQLALKKIAGDPRSFTLTVRYGSVVRGIYDLITTSKKRDAVTGELPQIFRAYLVRNLNAAQCADSVVNVDKDFAEGGYLKFVNEWLEPPITPDEVGPRKIEPAAQVDAYWTTPSAKALLMKYKRLRFGDEEIPPAKGGADSNVWLQSLTEFLNELEDWRGADERAEADYFHQKCNLYEALLEIVPTGPTRSVILSSFVRFLRDNNIQQESRIEWLLHANALIGRAQAGRDRSPTELLAVMRNSGDTTLRLYAELVDLTHPKPAPTKPR